MKFLKNVNVDLRANGMGVVLVAWCVATAVVGVFGESDVASFALLTLMFVGFGFVFVVVEGESGRRGKDPRSRPRADFSVSSPEKTSSTDSPDKVA